MSAKHTPGPWISNPNLRGDGSYAGTDCVWTNSDTPAAIAEVYQSKNAALIASAPDLLVALEEVIAELDGREAPQGAIWLDTGGMMLARAAIAKARGES